MFPRLRFLWNSTKFVLKKLTSKIQFACGNSLNAKYIKRQADGSYLQKHKHRRKVVTPNGAAESKMKYAKNKNQSHNYHDPVKYYHYEGKRIYHHNRG